MHAIYYGLNSDSSCENHPLPRFEDSSSRKDLIKLKSLMIKNNHCDKLSETIFNRKSEIETKDPPTSLRTLNNTFIRLQEST